MCESDVRTHNGYPGAIPCFYLVTSLTCFRIMSGYCPVAAICENKNKDTIYASLFFLLLFCYLMADGSMELVGVIDVRKDDWQFYMITAPFCGASSKQNRMKKPVTSSVQTSLSFVVFTKFPLFSHLNYYYVLTRNARYVIQVNGFLNNRIRD